jgi:predicted Rossmann fold flavoprotein
MQPNTQTHPLDVAILGAGAAGLMCAIESARRGRRTCVFERNTKPGSKILISGGGRCNFTNLGARPENFLSANPHFAKSALARYTPRDFIAMVERHGIRYHEKTLGQLFCDGSAAEIVAMLERECASAGARIITDCAIERVTSGDGFMLETSAGDFQAQSVVVATGGLSIPKIGATGFGYELARQFGLGIVETRPALVPLVFGPGDHSRFADLTGVSTDAVARAGDAEFREKLLFTHRGLSGPAILQASSYWRKGENVEIDLAPGLDVAYILREARSLGWGMKLLPWLSGHLPKRLAMRWLEVHRISKPMTMLSDREIDALDLALHSWRVEPAGTEGYLKAEVTAGGVDTAELSSKTLESRKQPGLYFIGEVVDVTGQLGGFNFQWAWASGYSAGQFV